MSNVRSFPKASIDDVYWIPYDENGKYLGKESKKLMKLDFSRGSKIKIVHPESVNHGKKKKNKKIKNKK